MSQPVRLYINDHRLSTAPHGAGFQLCLVRPGERACPLHSPQELVPVEGVEKEVSQGLLAHEVVQHGSWEQAAEREGFSSRPALPTPAVKGEEGAPSRVGQDARRAEGARGVSCEQPGQAQATQPGSLGAWEPAVGGGGRAHRTGPVSGPSPRLESEEPAPQGCRAETSAAAHTPGGRAWSAGLLPEAREDPGTCPPESLPPSSQHPHRMPLLSDVEKE